MPRGPAPTGRARRRNTPTIPTKQLPAAGRPGRAPAVPKGYELGTTGRSWWLWAWKQPQAVHWDHGHIYAVARRARLEDLIASIDQDDVDLQAVLTDALGITAEVVGTAESVADRVESLIRGLRAVAGGAAALYRQAGELDKVLGLTPKAMVDLRWELVAQPGDQSAADKQPEAPKVRQLRAVDPATG